MKKKKYVPKKWVQIVLFYSEILIFTLLMIYFK